MIKEGEAQARMKQIQVALDLSMFDKERADIDATMAKEKAESFKAEIQRLELMLLQLASITEERDRLRNVVNDLKERTNLEGGAETVGQTIVQELEISLSKKENHVIELEKKLVEQREISGHQHGEIKLLSERLTNEARRVKMLEMFFNCSSFLIDV